MTQIAITGARGFVGSMLARRFESSGWTVTRLSHSGPAADAVPFRLGDEVQPEIFRSRNITALVHCAYDFKPATRGDIDRINVAGSRKLLEAAAAGGVERIAVMSTISAFDGCRSLYGRAKLEIGSPAASAGAPLLPSRPGWGRRAPPRGGG